MATDPLAEALAVTLQVAAIFDELSIPYLVGGSLASSLHGVPRSTNDVDMVADLRPADVARFVARLGDAYYYDQKTIAEAIRRRASFNLIHQETVLKIDIFVLGRDPLAQAEMQRRAPFTIADDPESRLMLATPEDIVLQKLAWFRLGGDVSERQWRDVLGVLQVQGPDLDWTYLTTQAAAAGLSAYLDRARNEADSEGDPPG